MLTRDSCREIAVKTEKHLRDAQADRKLKEEAASQQLTLQIRPRNPFLHESERTSNSTAGRGGGTSCHVWFGEVVGDYLSYWTLREELSDAAYHGVWSSVFTILELARLKYDQSWINCTRLHRCKRSLAAAGRVSIIVMLITAPK